VAAGLDAFAAALAPAIREAQADGAIAAEADADTLAAFLVDAWQGALLRMRVEGNDAPLRRFERVVLGGLLGGPAREKKR
jgi:TetR/AcrR family transcriptional repressor of nem operon